MAPSSAGTADPLRSTLDNLQLDPRSEADRPYLVAMLRRLGYTERQIEETVRTGRMPAQAPAPDDGLAPPRDYRLVVPARDTRFELESAGAAAATDAPFEDLQRLEFEDASQEVEFEPVGEPTWGAAASAPDEPAEFEPVAEGQEEPWREAGAGGAGSGAPAPEDAAWQTTEEGAPGEGALAEGRGQPGEAAPAFEEGAIDTFGGPGPVEAARKTRVRVRRVRAGSREEAERKVAGEGRNVIKSVPVDIVERWGPGSEARPGKAGPEGEEGR
jgi:hypothetical protein